MNLSDLEGKRVAIWGYGDEGRAALAALRWRLPREPLALLCSAAEASQAMELGDPALYIFTEEVTADLLVRFDVVIKSPGISPYHGVAAQALARGVRFTSGTALWFAENPGARTLCVSGTKGKSTTSALIAHLLRAGGVRTALAGNIGLPLLNLLEADPPAQVNVLELSSYQTRDAVAPEVAVVLNLFPSTSTGTAARSATLPTSWRWPRSPIRAIWCSTPPMRVWPGSGAARWCRAAPRRPTSGLRPAARGPRSCGGSTRARAGTCAAA